MGVISHSCCPGKRDIRPPTFQLTESLKLHKGVLDIYTCEGCKTVIQVYVPKEEA